MVPMAWPRRWRAIITRLAGLSHRGSLTSSASRHPVRSYLLARHLLAPVDVVTVHPCEGSLAAAGDALEDHRQHEVTQHPDDGSGGFAAAGPHSLPDDAFHTLAAELLVGSERLLDVRLVAHAFGEHDGVFDGHGGPLSRGGRGGVRGVTHDDHRFLVPGRHPRHFGLVWG